MTGISRMTLIAGALAGSFALASLLSGCASGQLALHAATTPIAAQSGASGVSSTAAGGAPAGASSAGPQGRPVAVAPASGVAVPSSGVALEGSPLQPPQPASTALSHGITVTGQGQVEARPDEAIVQAGVQTRATTAEEAQANNNQTMQAVIDAIKAAGIPAKDIRTTGISLYPIIEGGNAVSGYTASNEVTITVENIAQTGAVLDAAVKAGANMAGGVRFTFKDETALRNRALAAAAADARSKADALASALGLTITGIQSVTEGQVVIPRPFLAAGAARVASAAAPVVPVQPGQQTISASVTVVFTY